MHSPAAAKTASRVHAVDDDARHAIAAGPIGDVDDRLVARLRGELAVQVVLADEDHGQRVERGHVRRLVEGAFVRRTVAEEADRDLVALAVPVGERGADGDGDAAGDDAVRAEHAELEVRDVHAAALAVAVAGRLAEQLRVHQPEVPSFGDDVAVPSMSRGDLVGVGEVDHDAGGDGLFPDIEVQRARDLPRLGEPARFLLEVADANHSSVQVEQAGRDSGCGSQWATCCTSRGEASAGDVRTPNGGSGGAPFGTRPPPTNPVRAFGYSGMKSCMSSGPRQWPRVK